METLFKSSTFVCIKSVSEELNSVETSFLFCTLDYEIIVSEELNSVETNPILCIPGVVFLQFQKNLIVWKQEDKREEETDSIEVSEELNSVETFHSRFLPSLYRIVSEELNSVETNITP